MPTPIITEILMEAEPHERDKVLAILHERFHIKEVDTLAAKHAADVWNFKKRSGVIAELQASGASMRTKLKVDVLILGVAMAENVPVLYSHDKGFRTLCEGYITARDIPDIPQQMTFSNLTSSPTASPPPSEQSPSASQV